jgi:hypothetical protein
MIQELANWGEFIGGIAVVISLIYVGVQSRSSVVQSKLDSYTKSTELWAHFTAMVAADGETWGIFHRGTHDYGSLDAEEKSRFGFLISMYFGIMDTIMTYEKAGIYSNLETYQRSLEQAYAVFVMPGVQQWFSRSRGRIFAPDIEDYLTSRMEKEGENV